VAVDVGVAVGQDVSPLRRRGGQIHAPLKHGADCSLSEFGVSAALAPSKLTHGPSTEEEANMALMWAPLIGAQLPSAARWPAQRAG